MKAIVTDAVYSNISEMLQNLKVRERQLPEPGDNQLLVKILSANVNPSDIAFLRGMYNVTKGFPAVPGFEGYGIVIEASPDFGQYIGKKVCCFKQDNTDGTWAEYVVVNANQCLVLKDNFPEKQAATFFINPFTAYGLIEQAVEKKAETIIQNAAAGQVGKIVRFLAKMNNIKVINIVRRPQHVDKLKNEGEELVLNSRDKIFDNQLKDIIDYLKPTIAFDAVAGEFTSKLLKLLPANSDIVIYGGLSGQEVVIDVLKIIFENKIIRGFNLNKWISESDLGKITRTSEFLQDLFIAGKLKTEIQNEIGFDDIYKGLYQYLTKMSDGKVLIKP